MFSLLNDETIELDLGKGEGQTLSFLFLSLSLPLAPTVFLTNRGWNPIQ